MQICVFIYICKYMRVCVCVIMYVCMCVCVCVYIYIYEYVHMYMNPSSPPHPRFSLFYKSRFRIF